MRQNCFCLLRRCLLLLREGEAEQRVRQRARERERKTGNNVDYVTVQKSRMSGTLGTVSSCNVQVRPDAACNGNGMGKRIAGAADGVLIDS